MLMISAIMKRRLDDGESGFDEGGADPLDLVGTHAAQDGDKRAALKPVR